MLGAQFLNVGGSVQDIQEIAADATMPGLTAEPAFQTTARLWNGSGYDTYGWCGPGDGTANGMPEWDSKWLSTGFDALATAEMDAGTGFWIETSGEGTITFAGEVPAESTVSIPVSAGFNLICNPFPESINIQDIQSSDLPGLTSDPAFQATIRLWNGSGYDTYGWCGAGDGTANGMPEWDSKWLSTGFDALATDTIGIGKGFWIETTTAANITFSK